MDFRPLIELIEGHQRFVITSHVRPDGDAIGSEIAMAHLLERHGRQAGVINPSATPARLQFLDPSHRVKKIRADVSIDEAADTDVFLILDTSSWQQLVDMGEVLRRSKAIRVVIDHHAIADDLDAVEFKDTTAPAT
ncbi:MAG: bifunctional oligoribonuclease/PAP phosphatase NrnA, partial [Planctomycetota bacterium]